MEPVYAQRRNKKINKKNKLHIVFDEAARREFLTGFHKRKLQRKKVAQEELQKQLKAERKRIKQESKEQFKKLLVHSYKPIPELEEQLAQEYKVENATVSVLELDTDLLAETNFLIGRNRGQCEDESEIKEELKEEIHSEEELPGMEIVTKKKTTEINKPKQEIEKESKTKKELKKELKKQATNKMKKSKVFQRKNRIERFKQKKVSMKLKKENMKIKAKSKKGKKQKFKKRNEKK